MRTTIKDIANYTGLSITTISLVLNGKGDKIPQKTKEIVFQAAKELNYSPNKVAIGLVKKRTYSIGLILPDISNVFFSNLAKGVEDACRTAGWNLFLCNTNDSHKSDMQYIQVMADKGVDGILYVMAAESDEKRVQECIHLMENLNIPYIMIDRYIYGENLVSLATNHKKGGYLATKYLIELGHKRIACITGPKNLVCSQNRLLGYKEALEEAGIPFKKELIYHGQYTIESGREAYKYLADKEYSAIFAFNDMSAFGVYKELVMQGIRVPDEISLVGYDNIFFCDLLDVPLTTIKQPVYEMGKQAVEVLVDEERMKQRKGNPIFIEPELVIRKSTAPCNIKISP